VKTNILFPTKSASISITSDEAFVTVEIRDKVLVAGETLSVRLPRKAKSFGYTEAITKQNNHCLVEVRILSVSDDGVRVEINADIPGGSGSCYTTKTV